MYAAVDFGPVADDGGVAQKLIALGLAKGRDFLWIKALIGVPITLSFAQDRDPRKTRLRTLQTQKLEQFVLIAAGHAPFVVVVRLIQGIGAAPGAVWIVAGIAHIQGSEPMWRV